MHMDVIPAQAGIQYSTAVSVVYWIPACAGMTDCGRFKSSLPVVQSDIIKLWSGGLLIGKRRSYPFVFASDLAENRFAAPLFGATLCGEPMG
jgi:hypothetical protein